MLWVGAMAAPCALLAAPLLAIVVGMALLAAPLLQSTVPHQTQHKGFEWPCTRANEDSTIFSKPNKGAVCERQETST